MEYSLFAPPDFLKDLVKCFFTIRTAINEPAPKEYFLMADCCAEIVFQLNGGLKACSGYKSYIRPQHSSHDKLEVESKIGLFGVRLYSHSLQQILSIPSHELVNTVLDLNHVFKQAGRDLADKVMEAKTSGERINLLTDFLLKRKLESQQDPMSEFTHQAFSSDGQVNLDKMRDRTGFSVRQFERRYEATAGFTPKYFARIARFQSTKRKYVTGQFRTLSELAYACNYFDQSHFIREFKEFSGLSVGPYFRLIGDKEDQEAKAIREFIVAKDLQRS